MPALPVFPLDWFFVAAAFLLGACIGSFLNVVIYRLPLGLSVNEPRRSFCPACKAPIKAWHNVPLFGWLWLRGKCAACHVAISPRYPAVELLTGLLFGLVWLSSWPAQPELAFPRAVLVAILIAATFIDLDHLIIPDELTWGGVVVGLVFAPIFPGLLGETSRASAILASFVGAVSGYGLLWLVVEAGKLMFGRKRVQFEAPQEFSWTKKGADDANLRIGTDEPELWSELFARESDVLELICERVEIGGKTHQEVMLEAHFNRVDVAGDSYPLAVLESFRGVVREAVVPREAMGFGDVKFLAAIGAFLGWKSVLFSVAAGSIVGSVLGLAVLPFRRGAQGLRLPFGPLLALGALLWLFTGPALVDWYVQLLSR